MPKAIRFVPSCRCSTTPCRRTYSKHACSIPISTRKTGNATIPVTPLAQDLGLPGAEQIQRRQREQRESATNAKGCQQLLAQIIRWHSIRNIQVGCGAQRNGNNHKECAGSIIWHICLPSFCVAGLKEKAHVHYLTESPHMEYIADRYKYRTARQRLLKQKMNNPEGNVNT